MGKFRKSIIVCVGLLLFIIFNGVLLWGCWWEWFCVENVLYGIKWVFEKW